MSTSNPTARRTRVERGIYVRLDGSYEIGWRDASGRQRWRVAEGGIRAARAALAEAHAERGRGVRPSADPTLRFADAAGAWWDARVRKWRPGTRSAYQASLKHLLHPENFGRSRIADITPMQVAQFVSRQQAAGLKGWTVKGQLSVLSAVFTYGARHLGLVGPNPVALLDRAERPSSDDEKPKRILNSEELGRLLAAFNDDQRLLFELAAETGARLSEVLGLVWNNIDLVAETVTFTHQLDRKGTRQPLKTRASRRCLEVTPKLIRRLDAHRSMAAAHDPRGLVFVNRAGSALDQRNVGGRLLAVAVQRSGLQKVTDARGETIASAPTFHDLRHSHASALIAAGWDPVEVSARLGHSSVNTTLRTYVHEFDAARRSDDRRSRLAALY